MGYEKTLPFSWKYKIIIIIYITSYSLRGRQSGVSIITNMHIGFGYF